jgi:hypothetical protein
LSLCSILISREGTGYIRAKTIIGNESKDFISEITNLTNAIFTIGAEIDIDYTVYVPKTAKLLIENSFGDIFIGNMNTNLQVDLSHGDLRAGRLNAFSIINVKFGKAFIEYLKEGKMDLNYSDLAMSKTNRIDIKSKVSTIDIVEAKVLSIDSKRDDYSIEKLDFLKGSSNFSKINVRSFEKEMNVSLKYGALTMEKISQLFTKLDMESNYTDITLIFEEGAAFNFSLTETEVSFDYPKESTKLEKTEINKEDEKYRYQGNFGGSKPQSKVVIVAHKGSVNIFHK